MPTGQQTSQGILPSANGASAPDDLFVLTDEQILEIEPEGEVNVTPGLPAQAGFSPASFSPQARFGTAAPRNDPRSVILSEPQASEGSQAQHDTGSFDEEILRDANTAPLRMITNPATAEHSARDTSHESPVTSLPAQAGHETEPPAWLAAQMKDPWSGEEARDLWNGVVQARQESAAYRAAIATPEDARALKELYPGGIAEARAAAGRARLLGEIDGAYFGAAGKSPHEVSASRANLAQHLLREDPAAFREMVFAGLRALEEAEKGSSGTGTTLPRLAQAFPQDRPSDVATAGTTQASSLQAISAGGAGALAPAPDDLSRHGADAGRVPGFRSGQAPGPLAASAASGSVSSVGAQHAAPLPSAAATNDAHVAAYAAFEKAANEDLDRSVGAAIVHTIEQALPNLKRSNRGEKEGARQGVPLPDRLGAAVRQDIEDTLKGDCQLGEQIAQILSARRFDNETRAQVVRLIDDRARQLVPSASRRVINDWTQTTLAAHRGNASRADAANARREVEPAAHQGPPQHGLPASQAGGNSEAVSSQASQTRPGADPHRNASRSVARRVDYRKLSDEQILDL